LPCLEVFDLNSQIAMMPSTSGPSALILIADGTEEMELYAVLVIAVSDLFIIMTIWQHNNL